MAFTKVRPNVLRAGGLDLLGGLEASGIFRYSTGLPYSKTNPTADTIIGLPNSYRLPSQFQFDALLRRPLRLGAMHGTVYLDIRNLTNRRNIVAVRKDTGTPGLGSRGVDSAAAVAYAAHPEPIPFESPRYRPWADTDGDGMVSGPELLALYKRAAQDYYQPLFAFGTPAPHPPGCRVYLLDVPIRRTKIVATLGPATSTARAVAALVRAGIDVARINASHGTAEQRASLIRLVREAAADAGRPVAILLDLQGPRIRVGNLDQPIHLDPGQAVSFAPEETAAKGQIPTTYDLSRDVTTGSRVLLDDGLIAVDVTAVKGQLVSGTVVYGGELKSHKGMNLPGIQVSAPPLTEKDIADAEFAGQQDVDFVALSFVRRAEDIGELRALLSPDTRIIAKIEKDTALHNIESIAEVSDGIMVARGDLGVELPFEQVPLAQKKLIRVAQAHRRPVITATQMLESMVHSPRPTRAEASDVANAILDGTDAVMLSAETAAGEYPRESVEAMDRIIREMERHDAGLPKREQRQRDIDVPVQTEHAVAAAAVAAARMLHAPLIVCFTKSGFTVRVVSAARPPVPVLAVTDEPKVYRQLALQWGVVPMLTDEQPRYDAMLDAARERILVHGYAKKGDRVVVIAGVPFDVPGATNMAKVEEV